MRILLINHFPLQGSGSGIYTLNVARELIKNGHQAYVIDIDCELDSTNYPFPHKTILCDKKKNDNPDLDFNFPCFTTHPRSQNTYYNISKSQIEEYVDTFVQATKTAVAKFKPDLIHAQHLWVAPYAAWKSGVPYVITVHGTDLMGFRKDARYHKFALEGAKNAARIITISRQVHQDTVELYHINEEKLILIPNGFDADIFKPKDINTKAFFQKFNLDIAPKKLVSFVGKFTKFKGIDILIRAAVQVTKAIPQVVFALVGQGELMNEMEKLKEELNLENIYFLGQQTQKDVSSLYSAADVSVVPSRKEPFGLVAIEALACGTPVVATNAGGLPDFINEKVGKLIEMENVDALAKAIISELNGNSKNKKGKYAQKYAKENYSWKKNLENVIEIYQTAINK